MKNKLFICFRPYGIETETESNGPDFFDDPTFTCIKIANHTSPNVKQSASTGERSKLSGNGIRKRKRVRSKSFSGVVKAVLFEILLKKKAENRKAPQLTVDSKSSDDFSDVPKAIDPNSSLTSCSSSSTSSNASENSNSNSTFRNKKKQRTVRIPQQDENRANGLLLILISLAITVFYGRLCAVLFTSVFLYFMSRRGICEQLVQPENRAAKGSPETESLSARDYRKRIIMEGLLERNHQRRGH